MKVAIYMGGRITSNKPHEHINHLKKLQQKYNITYFCSLNLGGMDEFTRNFCEALDITSECLRFEVTPEHEEIYNLGQNSGTNFKHVYSMFYHNKKCMDMILDYERIHNMSFDVIVKYRGDICDINSEFIIEMPQEHTVYIPSGADWGGINDQIAYGNKTTMIKYSDCVNEIVNYCKKGVRFHPETLLQAHLREHNFIIRRFNYNYFLAVK